MEWCLKLNDERSLLFERVRRIVLVWMVLCLICTACETCWTGVKASTGVASVSWKSGEVLRNKDLPKTAGIKSAEQQVVNDIIKPESAEESTETYADCKRPEISMVQEAEIMLPVLSQSISSEKESVTSEVSEEETIPVLPEIPDTMPDRTDIIYSESMPEDQTEAVVPEVIDGFYIDDEGMITGIADQSVISSGYLELPAEGCIGIRSGAFLSSAEGIRELYIPANISFIEIGALAGMWQLEWIEKESSGGCYTEDGVLFSEDGACILSFPASRTGSYKVPTYVTTIASDAFSGAQITALDIAAAQIQDMGNFPDNIEVIQSTS